MDPITNVNPTDKVKDFFSKYPKRSFPKGQILIHAGDQPDNIFYLVSGHVKQYDISYRGDEVIVNVFKHTSFFPMLSALTAIENKYFFTVTEDSVFHIAPATEVVAFIRQEPDVMLDLLTRIYTGLDGVIGRMVQLMTGSAKSRLLYELMIEAKRFGKPTDDGLVLSINESDLGARAGMSRETVSREIQKLTRDNLVQVTRSQIVIPNLDDLASKFNQTS